MWTKSIRFLQHESGLRTRTCKSSEPMNRTNHAFAHIVTSRGQWIHPCAARLSTGRGFCHTTVLLSSKYGACLASIYMSSLVRLFTLRENMLHSTCPRQMIDSSGGPRSRSLATLGTTRTRTRTRTETRNYPVRLCVARPEIVRVDLLRMVATTRHKGSRSILIGRIATRQDARTAHCETSCYSSEGLLLRGEGFASLAEFASTSSAEPLCACRVYTGGLRISAWSKHPSLIALIGFQCGLNQF
eukprot:scaffold4922_cov20-Prasinocladus_malaysianus.AAC.1